MRGLVLFLIAGVVAMAQAPTTCQPAGTMRQLMIDIIYPTSDAVFYVDRDTPKTAQDWEMLRPDALTLAESRNLLMMDVRTRDKKNWIMESKMLIDIGTKAY